MTANGLLRGQSTFASLRGTVLDPSGAAIARATVTVRNVAIQLSRETRTNEAGTYAVFDLPPSGYEVIIAAPGFSTQRLEDVELTVNAEELLDFRLRPSTVVSSVE